MPPLVVHLLQILGHDQMPADPPGVQIGHQTGHQPGNQGQGGDEQPGNQGQGGDEQPGNQGQGVISSQGTVLSPCWQRIQIHILCFWVPGGDLVVCIVVWLNI
jgi:hypothetical protein